MPVDEASLRVTSAMTTSMRTCAKSTWIFSTNSRISRMSSTVPETIRELLRSSGRIARKELNRAEDSVSDFGSDGPGAAPGTGEFASLPATGGTSEGGCDTFPPVLLAAVVWPDAIWLRVVATSLAAADFSRISSRLGFRFKVQLGDQRIEKVILSGVGEHDHLVRPVIRIQHGSGARFARQHTAESRMDLVHHVTRLGEVERMKAWLQSA